MEKGRMEALISERMISFQREQLGRGAESAKTYILKDMIIVRLKGALTAAEKQLASQEKGRTLIKDLRNQLEDIIRTDLEVMIEEVTGVKVVSVHNDISTITGEKIDVFILEKELFI